MDSHGPIVWTRTWPWSFCEAQANLARARTNLGDVPRQAGFEVNPKWSNMQEMMDLQTYTEFILILYWFYIDLDWFRLI